MYIEFDCGAGPTYNCQGCSNFVCADISVKGISDYPTILRRKLNIEHNSGINDKISEILMESICRHARRTLFRIYSTNIYVQAIAMIF